MDNLTHSLVGVALAQAVLPAGAPRGQRRLFVAAGLVAANLPDIDLAYVGITPAPLGYLLHHRGHTHTAVGLLAQGTLLALACGLAAPLRRTISGAGGRFAVLIAAGLLTHIVLDFGNSYGVHPFHPFDSRWYYGDAVFILEPWLWVLLGVPVAWNLGRIARVGLLAALGLLPVLMAAVGVLLPGPVVALVVGGALLAWAVRRSSPRARAMTALSLAAGFIALLFTLSAAARSQARAFVATVARGAVVDTILNPNPADPLCWMAIVIEADEAGSEYVYHTGTISLLPGWRPAASCASHRFTRRGEVAHAAAASGWQPPLSLPLAPLRAIVAEDCRAQAWMQFGRAPVLDGGRIYDLRFEDGRGNFTAMRLNARRPDPPCPPHLTSWAWPRADLFSPRSR